jgi:hypothetical protein
MLHIPDDRLHAYLDQALDRLESAAIESHLAECAACRADRDAIITLRDRTTALLARAAARHAAGPPFAKIRALADERRRVRQLRLQRTAWAASIVLALGTGWSASWYTHRTAAAPAAPPAADARATTILPAPVAEAPAVQPPLAQPPAVQLPQDAPAPPIALAAGPAPESPTRSIEATHQATHAAPVATKSSREHPAAAKHPPAKRTDGELATVGSIPKDAQLENGGMWRILSWDGAKEAAGDAPPRIAGLPVMEVQVQGGNNHKRPMMVVAQQLASGEVVRTIEGPAADVSALLGTRPGYVSGESASTALPTNGTPSAALGTAMALRRGDRMVAVTGSVSRDSLKAMMLRLNLMKQK